MMRRRRRKRKRRRRRGRGRKRKRRRIRKKKKRRGWGGGGGRRRRGVSGGEKNVLALEPSPMRDSPVNLRAGLLTISPSLFQP
ncbi:hypothetical protein PoB_005684300 [Plakobranchus ocellatus]|uniref:Uncharacterized protein n=1 Tax=Plakobranchus ocellatus TaxID=259542 RepID=A0AAV4CEH9_9GAST|nr:hypothetical protein PoB_005684300 [Plakobranchus ocellatus]